MSNWNKPDLSSTEVDAILEYKGRDVDGAVMFDAGTITNIPDNAIRFNVASGLFQRRENNAWVNKLISVAGGGTGADNRSDARDNLGLGSVAVESVLPIAKGGTGQTSALAGLNALGGRNASNLNTGTVAVARLPNATTSVAGISQLSSSTTTDSVSLSANARAVKNVQDDVNLKLTASLSLSDVASALAARDNIGASNAANLTTGTIPNARITNATTSIAGITQLINSTTNSSQTGAATANSVRLVAERSVGAGNGLTGGGSLQASRTITMGTPSTLSGGSANSVSGTTHTHAISSTASRTNTSTSTLLEAKGMNDHRNSGDHDSRYARDINSVSGGTYYDYIIAEKPTFFYHSSGGTPSDSPTGSQASVLTMPNAWGDPMLAIPNSGEGLYWRNGNSTAWRQAGTKADVDAASNKATPKTIHGTTSNADDSNGHTHAISATTSRTNTSSSTLLAAGGMNNHRTSGDHDGRYYTKAEVDVLSAPIGSTYVQFPGESSPAALYGGSWSRLFDSEGVFFRTEGTGASGWGGGIQGDTIQNIEGSLTGSYNNPVHLMRLNRGGNSGALFGSGSTGRGADTSGATGRGNRNINFNASRSVRTSSETRPRNRTIRVWKRIS